MNTNTPKPDDVCENCGHAAHEGRCKHQILAHHPEYVYQCTCQSFRPKQGAAQDSILPLLEGLTLRQYLEKEFPATIGHIPLQMYYDALNTLQSQLTAAKDYKALYEIGLEESHQDDITISRLQDQLTAALEANKRANALIGAQADENDKLVGSLNQKITVAQELSEKRRVMLERLFAASRTVDLQWAEISEEELRELSKPTNAGEGSEG